MTQWTGRPLCVCLECTIRPAGEIECHSPLCVLGADFLSIDDMLYAFLALNFCNLDALGHPHLVCVWG